jgi:hypothetical protein
MEGDAMKQNDRVMREIKQSLGYIKLDSGPIELDYDIIQLEENNYGVDVLQADSIVTRACEIDITDTLVPSDSGSILKDKIIHLTFIVVKYLERHRIPGEIVLYYETIQQGYDFQVVCKAYSGKLATRTIFPASKGGCDETRP